MRSSTWKWLVLVIFLSAVSFFQQGQAQGLTLVVNSTGNESDDDVVNNRFPDKRCDVDPNTTGDQCTLRAAIETHDAYRAEAGNAIQFNIPLPAGTATARIKVENEPLFPVRGQLHLDGTSQPGYMGKPIIELDGSMAGGDGLQARGTGSIIEGLNIHSFSGWGIRIEGTGGVAENHIIRKNFIGTDPTGTIDKGNGSGGVLIIASPATRNNTIEDNVISGNGGPGIEITGENADHNTIDKNKIGLNEQGDAAIPNEKNGVVVSNGAQSNDIGLLAGQGNLISGNRENGVLITGAGTNKNRLHNNTVGTNRDRNAALPNSLHGVAITQGAKENEVGGLTGDGNLISGNEQNGIQLNGTGTDNNLVRNNTIGLNGAEDAALGNGTGIEISGGSTINIIGLKGTQGTQGNLISGNRENGVLITGEGTLGHSLHGNLIGSNRAGNKLLPNGANGVAITSGANGNDIGGPFAEQSNLISGNTENGVLITGNVRENRVSGNKIGTNLAGNAPLPNNRHGVMVSGGAMRTRVGGFIPEMGNLISGNGQNGVLLTGAGTTESEVDYNRIGSDVTGEAALPNGAHGVAITLGASTNHIGSVSEEPGGIEVQKNLILFNKENGVLISGSGTLGNKVQGNTISVNKAHGVAIVSGAQNNIIGENSGLLSEGNTISLNVQNGILISGAGTDGNIVAANYIGTDDTGGGAEPNGSNGVAITMGAKSNKIGRSPLLPEEEDEGEGNVISGNLQNGVLLSGAGTENNVVQKNFIGTDYLGGTPVPNGLQGVAMELGAKSNILGFNNLLSGNTQNGVVITGAGTDGNSVLGNKIGTNAAGTAALGNTAVGVVIAGGAKLNRVGGGNKEGNLISGNGQGSVLVTGDASDENLVLGNMIGGFLEPQSPIQADNGIVDVAPADQGGMQAVLTSNGVGISVVDADAATISNNILTAHSKAVVLIGSATGIPLSGNLIFNNAGPAIDLGDDGVTPNDAGDADTGPNNRQNFPVLTAASSSGGNTAIQGALNSLPNSTFRLEFFANTACDPSGFGEGETFLGFHQVTTNGTGDVSFTANLVGVTVPDGAFITATATDPDHNTGEFSACVPVGTVAPMADLELSKQADKSRLTVGEQVQFTVRLLNKGPDAATHVAVSEVAPAGLTFNQVAPSLGSFDVNTGIWSVSSLHSGQEATLVILATATQAGTPVNTAEVMSSDQPDPDSAPGNGQPAEDDQSSVAVAVEQVSPEQQTLELIARVVFLIADGEIQVRDGRKLVRNLVQALIQMERDKTNNATRRLEAFIGDVQELAAKGQLSVAVGQELVGAAQTIIGQLNGQFLANRGQQKAAARLLEASEAPAATRRLGNYPNPFFTATMITFELEKPARVQMAVYDQSGKIVALLLDGMVPAGLHTLTWRPDKLPDGVYILHLQADHETKAHRMLYLR